MAERKEVLVARKGDRIVVNARRVGGPLREGNIIEVIEGELRVQYWVRWSDGHQSLFAPALGTATIEPARGGGRASAQRTAPKKSPTEASTAKSSRPARSGSKKVSAKTATAKKSMATTSAAKRSTAKKGATKKAAARGRTGSR
jgi:hypothetical protein